MRRKHKLFYWVCDDNRPPMYWSKDGWGKPVNWSSSSKTCWTFDQAVRVARKLKAVGGEPMILQFCYRKGKRLCREYRWQ